MLERKTQILKTRGYPRIFSNFSCRAWLRRASDESMPFAREENIRKITKICILLLASRDEATIFIWFDWKAAIKWKITKSEWLWERQYTNLMFVFTFNV